MIFAPKPGTWPRLPTVEVRDFPSIVGEKFTYCLAVALVIGVAVVTLTVCAVHYPFTLLKRWPAR